MDKVLAAEEPIFAQAVRAVITADVSGLKRLLGQNPDLISMRAKAVSLRPVIVENLVKDSEQLS